MTTPLDTVDFDAFVRHVAWPTGDLDKEATARLHHWYERAARRQHHGASTRWAFISREKAAA